MDQTELEERCFRAARKLCEVGANKGIDLFELTELLITLELEKIEKDKLRDQFLPFNDKIVSIEPVGEKETVDISVTGDNLFFCNNILTKNSFGVPMTMDLQIAMFSTEEMDHQGKIIVKQLKNRYNSLTEYNKFALKIDRSKMRLMDDDDVSNAEEREHSQSVPEMQPLVDRSINSGAMVFEDDDEPDPLD